MKAHVRKFHSEAAKGKASVNDELDRLELLHADKVPRLNVESQTGGAVMTRGTKRKNEEEDSKNNVKESNPDDTDQTLDTTEEYGSALLVMDHYTFLEYCPPTPPLSQHFALSGE